ncbi:hypothetical protein [Streptomyces sp. HC307]|uniref:hypothetical protein n=1 Tax=Streptomyces flavusporus TaxID=3385496 RepID=UPI0039174396
MLDILARAHRRIQVPGGHLPDGVQWQTGLLSDVLRVRPPEPPAAITRICTVARACRTASSSQAATASRSWP